MSLEFVIYQNYTCLREVLNNSKFSVNFIITMNLTFSVNFNLILLALKKLKVSGLGPHGLMTKKIL